jgi:hypothetical protein
MSPERGSLKGMSPEGVSLEDKSLSIISTL